MSFASQTKKELTSLEIKDCCAKAELTALLRMNGSLSFSSNKGIALNVTTENAAIARKIYTSLKRIFQAPAEVLVRKKMRLKKNNIYMIRVTEGAKELLVNLDILSPSFEVRQDISPAVVKKTCCKRAYLRGSFLAGGSINHPESASYHLEIFNSYVEHAQALVDLLADFGIQAKIIERKKGHVLYIKESEKITEFLNIIGAHQALFQFEDARIVKDMRNSVNRLVNCETANLNKTVAAAMKQLENIQLIDKHMGIDNLPEKLRELAKLRLEHPDLNLKEIAELLPGEKVSKSGINHRFRKINEIAQKFR